jgi:uncharacterized protein YggE
MNAHGGRWIKRLTCIIVLGAVASACSSSDSPEKPAAAPSDSTAPAPAAGATGDTPVAGSTGSGPSVGLGSPGGFVSSGAELALAGSGIGDSGPPGLTVAGVATGTARADQAAVVVLPSINPTSQGIGNVSVSPQDRRAVVDALAAIKVAAKDVSFDSDPRTGQPQVRVNLPVDQLAARGPAIVQAVEKTLGRSRSSGATFLLGDCEAATAPLRRQAVDQAQGQAHALADASHLTLGTVIAITQGGTSLVPNATCPSLVPGDVEAFDAPPQAKLSVAVRVTYAIAGAPATSSPARPLLWAAGTATAKGKADQAYVVAVFESDNAASSGPSAADRARLYDALAKLKVDRKDVEVTTRSDYGPTTFVQVETKAVGLDKTGTDIVRAVEDVLGRSDSSGARFASSTCDALVAGARKDAVADGRKRAAALATAASVKLSDLQSLAEFSGAGNPCDESVDAFASLDDYSSALQPFDADPVLSVTAVTQLGFAFTA